MDPATRAASPEPQRGSYRGRLAPSPTGLLHLGHARTFWVAQERARAAGGTLILRNEDLDRDRSKPQFVTAMFEDLRWFGLHWQEGPDVGGPVGPYVQSERIEVYRDAFARLRSRGAVYPCSCSRKDIQRALSAPQAGDEEPIYPGTCRPGQKAEGKRQNAENEGASDALLAEGPPAFAAPPLAPRPSSLPPRVSWRFRVPDGEVIEFLDGHFGPQRFVAGRDFGDFVVWRHDALPAYQLAVVLDDAAMQITEVVRGADLLLSTARQLLLYRALGLTAPAFFHCPLVTDEHGVRLAKRHDALSLRHLRESGARPEEIRRAWTAASCGGTINPSRTGDRLQVP